MMIQWLNLNQGFAMCLLTLVSVLSTLVIVVINAKSINEMRRTREDEERPYVLATLDRDPRDLCFSLRIKNYGKSGAMINHLSITSHMKLIDTKLGDSVLNNCILAPNQMLQFLILEKSDVTCESTYKIDISYTTIGSSKKYIESYTLITQYSHMMGYTNHNQSNLNNTDNALENIAANLDSIRTKI